MVEARNITKKYGDKPVLKNISFGVDEGEIVSIIGPSGAGKTTLLKLIAGIENPDDGQIRFLRPPSREHPVILVFQDYILFPNMTVFENVAFGLKARRWKKKDVEDKVCSFLDYFGVKDKAENYPNQLSAGQQQRVAIARAMVVSPRILLLDEPYANLDRGLKMETAEFIRSTQKKFGITTISVTHDLEEAFAMSDKIGIIREGSLIQYDDVKEVYFNPASYEAARFLGPVNMIPRRLFPSLGIAENDLPDKVYARAEAMQIVKDEMGAGKVTDVCFIGLMILYRVEIDDVSIDVYSLSDAIELNDSVSIKVLKYFRTEGDFHEEQKS